MEAAIEQWVSDQASLLALEKQAEVDQSLESNNTENFLSIRIKNLNSGLFGRSLLTLGPKTIVSKDTTVLLPAHKFTINDIVQLSPKSQGNESSTTNGIQGIVTKVTPSTIALALDDIESLRDYWNDILILQKLANETTYRKMKEALSKLSSTDCSLAQIVFGNQTPRVDSTILNKKLECFNAADINTSQEDAIKFALASKDIALIHGPPGTGKTTTLVEFIQQAVCNYNKRILVCAPSNVAVDNILVKTAKQQRKRDKRILMTRVGHPARLLPEVLAHCLDAKIQNTHGTEIIRDVKKELNKAQASVLSSRSGASRRALRSEVKLLKKEIRTREEKIVKEIISQSQVIFATNVGAASRVLKDEEFDICIIDEAAQALEASCWIPILKTTGSCVFAGDHCQLPPTVKSEKATTSGLSLTLFDRLRKKFKTVVRMLDTQYRMHENISTWSSNAMYEGKLKSDSSVANRMLRDLSHVTEEDDISTLILFDTSGCDLEETTVGKARSNVGEARMVKKHVEYLVNTGLRESEIAVITPYNGQVELIRSMLLPLYPTLEIRSVDGFQGCEKEAMVMSLVRSNTKREVGFLSDERRINVAVTRAKRHVALICDYDTVCSNKFIKQLLEHFEEHGEHRSVDEFLQDEVVIHATPMDLPPVKILSRTVAAKVPPAPVIVKKPKEVRKSCGDDAPKVTEKAEEEVIVHSSSSDDDDEDDVCKPVTLAYQQLQLSSSSEEEEEKPVVITKKDISPEIPPQNTLLASLHQERVERNNTSSSSATNTSTKTKKKKKKKKKKVAPTEEEQRLNAMDEDSFLDAQAISSKNCSYKKCVASNVSLYGSICKLCKLKFCLNHCQPEVHGCTIAAREFAQQEFKKKRNDDTKPLSATNRKTVQTALRKKLAASSSERKTKKKKK